MQNKNQTELCSQQLTEYLQAQAKLVRSSIVTMLTQAKSSHLGCCFSITDILTVLYNCFLNRDLIARQASDRDYFILSKGHSAAALYATLASVNLIPAEILKSYYADGSVLGGHPMKGSLPGVESSTGSLGHGLSMAVGLAYAAKVDGLKNKIYVLVGDGESQEGSMWEAIMMAARFKLNNLVLIVDYNNLQGLDATDDLVPGTWRDKFAAFAWNVTSIDGHNVSEIFSAFSHVGKTDKPDVIIARTTKGQGVSFIENKIEWHYKSFSADQYIQAQKELC
jgi:transketolase